jgi:two-component system sensor histidine kinase/response regulator
VSPDSVRLTTEGAGGHRVLVVDDNVVNQRVAVLFLEHGGYATEVVANGAEALAALGRGRYHAVLMDCEMPVMDGYAATAAIRRGDAGGDARIPIVAVTASAMPGDAERALAAGVDAYLIKPIDGPELLRVLGEVLHDPVPVDQRVIDHLLRIDASGDALRDLVHLFLRDTPPLIDALVHQASSGDPTLVAAGAHAIRGAAATFRARPLADAADRIERGVRAGTLPTVEDLEALRTALAGAVEHLRRLVDVTPA